MDNPTQDTRTLDERAADMSANLQRQGWRTSPAEARSWLIQMDREINRLKAGKPAPEMERITSGPMVGLYRQVQS